MKQIQYEIHPAATIFPMMDDMSFDALKADIQKNGLEKVITFYQGKVLDGRNRLRACQELGIEPYGEEIEDDGSGTFDPYQWVLSMNLHRRHLTESQRAMIGGRLATLKRGYVKTQREKDDAPIGVPSSIEESANMLNVGQRSVVRAKQVLDAGSKEIIEAVDSGTLPVSFAAKFVTEEPDKKTQTQLLKKGGKAALKEHITEPSPFVDGGIRKKPSHDEACVNAFLKADNKLQVLDALIDKLTNEQRSYFIESVRRLDTRDTLPNQGDSNQRNKYVELSLQGKWIAVARSWLEDNCPCSVDEYYQCVSQLMPTHIASFRGNRNPQLSMAKAALYRLEKGYSSLQQAPCVDVIDGRITLRSRT